MDYLWIMLTMILSITSNHFYIPGIRLLSKIIWICFDIGLYIWSLLHVSSRSIIIYYGFQSNFLQLNTAWHRGRDTTSKTSPQMSEQTIGLKQNRLFYENNYGILKSTLHRVRFSDRIISKKVQFHTFLAIFDRFNFDQVWPTMSCLAF